MSNPPSRAGVTARGPMPAFGTFAPQQASASFLLGRSNPDLRRSTPDSEAIGSSDDEAEHSKTSVTGGPKPITERRKSWLQNTSLSNPQRKPSMTGNYSPSTSHPGTPGTESSPWTNTAVSGAAAWPTPVTSTSSYPWNSSTFWSVDSHKKPSARRHEVLTATDQAGIPFAIPLEPTIKPHRSQSYSVGQQDTTSAAPANVLSTANDTARFRMAGQQPSNQRRTSKNNGLGGIDSGGLERLREVDDDDEGQRGVTMNSHSTFDQTRMIQRLVAENSQLRHEAQNRANSSTLAQTPSLRNSRFPQAVPEEQENAIDDSVDYGVLKLRDNAVRRMSEQALGYTEPQAYSSAAFDNTKKGQWQSSLGFGPIPEVPQSRRHSFADVPTRHGSFSSTGRDDDVTAYGSGSQALSQGGDRKLSQALSIIDPNEDEMKNLHLRLRNNSADYFSTNEATRRLADDRVHHHRDSQLFGQHLGVASYLEPVAQPLFIVNFKCCRSEVFYIQDGTGLHVNVGDLVIVEADRGTDLGTVQHTNISWDDARRYKDHYAEEHYKWLMMFSQQSRNGGPNVVNPNGIPNSHGSAIGGMGPQGHHGGHESAGPDLKPKMIKRLAQNHEIQALKDKEGNEAKAKRVCQQKVIEHRLNMEILDAEFQMDSKKLTFYYFADNYINFNHLVTDLFKIYKTRIWMSAINPASFQTPTSSLGIQPLYGAGAGAGDDRRPRRPQQPHDPPMRSPQAVTTPFGDTFDADRNFNNPNPVMRSAFYNQFQDVAAGPQHQQLQANVPSFAPSMGGQIDPFMSYYGQPYPALNPNAPNFASTRPEFRGRAPPNQPGVDNNWMGRFHGLSLGS